MAFALLGEEEEAYEELQNEVPNLIVEELEKIKAEIEKLNSTDIGSLFDFEAHHGAEDMKFNVTRIIEKHISELKGEEL